MVGQCGPAVRPRHSHHQVSLLPQIYILNLRMDSDAPGVETRIPGFGNTSLSVEWIDKSMRSFSTYFAAIVEKILPQVCKIMILM